MVLKPITSQAHEQPSVLSCHAPTGPKLLPILSIGEQLFPCRWASCNLIFSTPFALDIHLHRAHLPQQLMRIKILTRLLADGQPSLRVLRCRYRGCGKAFSSAKELSGHFAAHTGKRYHQCLWCRKSFMCYFDREVWGYEGWHEGPMTVRGVLEHAGHMVRAMEKARGRVDVGGLVAIKDGFSLEVLPRREREVVEEEKMVEEEMEDEGRDRDEEEEDEEGSKENDRKVDGSEPVGYPAWVQENFRLTIGTGKYRY